MKYQNETIQEIAARIKSMPSDKVAEIIFEQQRENNQTINEMQQCVSFERAAIEKEKKAQKTASFWRRISFLVGFFSLVSGVYLLLLSGAPVASTTSVLVVEVLEKNSKSTETKPGTGFFVKTGNGNFVTFEFPSGKDVITFSVDNPKTGEVFKRADGDRLFDITVTDKAATGKLPKFEVIATKSE